MKEKKTKGEDEKRDTQRYSREDEGADEKTGSHAPYFLSQEQGRERAGGGWRGGGGGCMWG